MSTEAFSIHKLRAFSKRCCPYCGCSELWRLRRRGLVERYLFRVFRLVPHQCTACDHRFYVRDLSDLSQKVCLQVLVLVAEPLRVRELIARSEAIMIARLMAELSQALAYCAIATRSTAQLSSFLRVQQWENGNEP